MASSQDSDYGFTEEEQTERRRLRIQQRNLHDEILDNKDILCNSIAGDLYKNLRDRNNDMFEIAKHCREQYLDVENLRVNIYHI
jgi:hypothetical protein